MQLKRSNFSHLIASTPPDASIIARGISRRASAAGLSSRADPHRRSEPGISIDERPRRQIFAVDVQKIEQEEHERRRVAAVGRQLDYAERSDAVGAHAAELAVEIGLAHAQRRYGGGDRRIFVRPVEPGARQQLHCPTIEARVHAVAVAFDFVEPLFAIRRLVDELGQLRSDPSRQRGDGALHGKLIGSISDGSLFFTLPTRVLTGQQIISSEGYGASTAFKSRSWYSRRQKSPARRPLRR